MRKNILWLTILVASSLVLIQSVAFFSAATAAAGNLPERSHARVRNELMRSQPD
jgi:hypothetical protein